MLTYIIIGILLIAAELVYFRLADRFNIIDKPNERSSHTRIVLRGGGVIYIIGLWIWSAFFGFQYPWFLVAATMLAIVNMADDIHSQPKSVRLLFQFVAVAMIFYGAGLMQLSLWWAIAIGLVVCVGIINAYNFMDGINGINGGYTFAVLIPILVECLRLKDESGASFVDESLLIVAMIANFVFCLFNFRPKGMAKCFAGDVGSEVAAFIVIFALGLLILYTGDYSYLVFLAVYGVDAVLTICHRFMLHENVGEAHRKHAYQLMANELGMEHTVVSAIYMVLQSLIAFGMMLIPATPAWHWGYFAGVCLVLAVAYLLFMKKNYHLHEEYLASLHSTTIKFSDG